MLNSKISASEKEAQEQEEQNPAPTKASSGPSTTEVVGKSVLKVLTSATFIRGAFGILAKILKK